MIGSHNIPPPPSNDKAFIAAVSGEPDPGKEELLVGVGSGIDIKDIGKLDGIAGIEVDGKGVKWDSKEGTRAVVLWWAATPVAMGGKPDIILENSTGSIPAGIGVPAAAAAATISAGVGSKVPVTTLWYTGMAGAGAEVGDVNPGAGLA